MHQRLPRNNPLVVRGDGKRWVQGPWTLTLLPFLEQANLYNSWNLDPGFAEGGNLALVKINLPFYCCPSDPTPAIASFPPPSPASFTADSTALGTGIRYDAMSVDYPAVQQIRRPPMDNNAKPNMYSFHDGGAQILLGDGSVRFLIENSDMDVFYRLFAIQDGNPLPEF